MSLLTRFAKAFTAEDQGADEPSGLIEDQQGRVYYIKPDGTRVEVGGGGSQTVTCQLLTAAIDVSAAINHSLLWNALQDNPWAENTLLAIPAGLGMTFAFDGSDSTLTTTAAGTWALSLALIADTVDNDWRGHYDDGLWGQSLIGPNVGANPQSIIVAAVMDLPAAAQIQPSVITDVAAAATQKMIGSLIVTRLA